MEKIIGGLGVMGTLIFFALGFFFSPLWLIGAILSLGAVGIGAVYAD